MQSFIRLGNGSWGSGEGGSIRFLMGKIRGICYIGSLGLSFRPLGEPSMRILMDADACPRVIKDIIFRAVARVKVPLIMVSNLSLSVPDIPLVSHVNVPGGLDQADDKIIELLAPGDLVITADIPLADRAVTHGAFALDPRGDFHSAETIKARLALRNLMEHLRSTGTFTGGPAPFNPKDRMAFANQLDKFLAKNTAR